MSPRDYAEKYSSIPALDTPSKPSITLQTARLRTMAADVEKMVEAELKSHCVVTDTDDFINHHFNVPSEVIEKVYNEMVDNNHYDEVKKSWPLIPQESKKESSFYSPLIEVCEAIRKAHDDDNKQYDCRWFMSPDNAPKSQDKASSLIRPDVFLLLGMEGEAEQWEEKLKELTNDQTKLIKNVIAWWLRVSVIIEVKRKDDTDVLTRVTQLMTYLRQVLREQLDRWFVPGLLLTGTQLAAWVVDRSGAFGTQKSFNFHEEPRKFIQVILACSTLPPSKLGWDTSMKLWKKPSPLHSFSEEINIEDYAENAYTRRWVLEMPVRNEHHKLDGKRGLFITTKALSVVRAECMQGRATVVWAVQQLKDGEVASDEILILKQCWRPITAKPEGELYPPAEEAEKHHIGRVYSYEDIKVNGITINTRGFVRGGLKYKDPLAVTNSKESRKRAAENFESAEKHESHVFIVPETDHDPLIFNFNTTTTITDRVLSRTLLSKSHGWALHRFSDRLELVRVCDHTVEALEFLYFQKGTLQRDISIGNVLISSVDGVTNTKGCLIDFDYAKIVGEKKPTIINQASDLVLNEDQKVWRDVYKFRGKKLPLRAAHALAPYAAARDYLLDLETIIGRSSLSDEVNLSEEDIGFLSENIQIPDLSKREAQEAKRSATVPFASPEILDYKPRRIFQLPLSDFERNSKNSSNYSTPPHDARHDLEALFWCMTYICITREGPGGKRRKELRPEFKVEDNEDVMQLRHINYCFFSSDEKTLVYNKIKLFQENDYEEAIICHFHPYFEPLKPLMRQWWNILCFTHQYPMFETIHKALRQVLASTLEALSKQSLSGEDRKKTDKVLEERRKELEELRCPFHSESNEDSESTAPLDMSPRHDRILRSHHARSDYLGSDMPPSGPTYQLRKKVKTSAAGSPS